MEKRSAQPLSVKLENLITVLPKLIKNAEFKQVKEKFTMPIRDETLGLYKFDANNQFYTALQVPRTICKGILTKI